jgi:hypothetical protein
MRLLNYRKFGAVLIDVRLRERVTMPFDAILHEVDRLQSVSARLEELAEQHPFLSEPLLTISGSVRNTATLLEVLVATRRPKPI